MLNLLKKHPVVTTASEARAILEALQKLENSARDCRSKREAQLAILQRSRTNMADQSAEDYLAGRPQDSGRVAEIDAAERSLAVLEASIEGLEKKAAGLRASVLYRSAELEAQFAAFVADRIAQFVKTDYEKAVESFAAVNRQLMAIAMATGNEQAQRAAESAAAFSPVDGSFILEKSRQVEFGPVTAAPNWQEDSKAKRLFDEFAEIKSVIDSLQKVVSDDRNRAADSALRARGEALHAERKRSQEEEAKAKAVKGGREPSQGILRGRIVKH